MPTYSYACKSCPAKFDVRQSFDDAALTQCPECGGDLRKLFGRVGVVFKGSGFYRTDSRGRKSSVPASKPAASTESAASTSTPAASQAQATSSPAPAAAAPTAAPSTAAKAS